MPELPEVETVKRGLEALLGDKPLSVAEIRVGQKKLRFNPNLEELAHVKGQKVLGVRRLAKYLLFELQTHFILSHLGMTGSWRIESDQRKHDHIQVFLSDQRILTYNDPRRFGMFDVFRKNLLASDKRFVHLGLDPVLSPQFLGSYLKKIFSKKSAPVKSVIMDQRVVVGVGNIYASEALYLAGIHPKAKASSLSGKECDRLCEAIQAVLLEAIACGGTTISDFKQAGGSAGYFQNFLLAYGRDGELCRFCHTPIQSQVIGGRNSFWCPDCQKT